MTVFKTSKWGTRVEPVEVLRISEKSIFITNRGRGRSERRENRVSEWATYHETLEQAVTHQREYLTRKAQQASETAARAAIDLAEFERWVSA